MTAPFDETDFVDRDLQSARTARVAAPSGGAVSAVASRPPTREELENKVGETQQRIVELKRTQEELERERTALEEARRRRQEFETGRGEVLQQLTRGVALLEQAEFQARRDAEQMAKTLAGFREVLAKVQAIHEETWTTENWNVELTRALATVENGRMEWNAARLKWTLLDGASANAAAPPGEAPAAAAPQWLDGRGFWPLCRAGLALTWPVAVAVLLALVTLVVLLWRR